MGDAKGSDVALAAGRDAGTGKSRARRTWDDAPLRTKVTWLTLAACMWGAVVGLTATTVGWGAIGTIAGAAIISLFAVRLGSRWIARPVEQMVARLGKITQVNRPLSVESLPCDRHDEIGQLARAVHRITVAAFRDRTEANNLRKTLDWRVEQATRQATTQLSQMAMRDALTNMGNRRFLEHNLEKLVESCRGANTDLVCVMMDLDYFKQVNDTLGHAAGDELLRFVSGLIRGSLREGDYAIRLGGDEFVVFMPGGEVERAEQFAQHVQRLFAEHARVMYRGKAPGLKPGVSYGIASMLDSGAKRGLELMEKADAKLYDAKQKRHAGTA